MSRTHITTFSAVGLMSRQRAENHQERVRELGSIEMARRAKAKTHSPNGSGSGQRSEHGSPPPDKGDFAERGLPLPEHAGWTRRRR